MPDVRWRLEWYEPLIESWEGKVLFCAPLADLRQVFGLSPDDPMRDQYEVKPEHVDKLMQWTGQVFEFDFYEYYLSAAEEG
jgi:hypothetical protein